jgi:hypothetical protein
MPKHWTGFVLLAAAFLLAPRLLSAQVDSGVTAIDPEKAAAVRTLLQVRQTSAGFIVGLEAGLEAERAANPEFPEVFLDEFLKRARADAGDFVEQLVPIFARLYSLDEVEQLTEFYQTPVGMRLVETQAELALEIARVGEQWGAVLAAEVMLDLTKRGVIP